MTPERKEEIKLSHEYMTKRLESYPSSAQIRMNDDIAELLAALEEAEKKAVEWEQHARTEYMIHNEIQDELREAQQTIARLTEALEWYAESSSNAVARVALGERAKESIPPSCPKCGNKNVAEHPTHKDVYLCGPCNRIFGAGEQP